MDGISTQVFSFATPAGPDLVWAALTRPALTATYLYGFAVESEWRPGATVSFVGPAGSLSGQVLAAEEPGRLSYSVRADEGQPEAYVTWEVLGDAGGTVVRLYVDEPGEAAVETAWAEVVARLESVLASTVTDHGAADRRL